MRRMKTIGRAMICRLFGINGFYNGLSLEPRIVHLGVAARGHFRQRSPRYIRISIVAAIFNYSAAINNEFNNCAIDLCSLSMR